jgi:hypothetical protein
MLVFNFFAPFAPLKKGRIRQLQDAKEAVNYGVRMGYRIHRLKTCLQPRRDK